MNLSQGRLLKRILYLKCKGFIKNRAAGFLANFGSASLYLAVGESHSNKGKRITAAITQGQVTALAQPYAQPLGPTLHVLFKPHLQMHLSLHYKITINDFSIEIQILICFN